MKDVKKISEQNLENVSGGANIDIMWGQNHKYLTLSQEEYDVLEKAGYIVDGKFDTKYQEAAMRCLANHDFDFDDDIDCTNSKYFSDDAKWVKIKIKPYT